MVYQDLALCDTLDVAQNIFLGREPKKTLAGLSFIDHHTLHEEAERVLERLHINVPSTRVKVKHLSGGQRQAIAIGRALTFAPKVLILDEPTAALAVKEVGEVLDLIRKLRDEGVGVILISHRLQDVMAVSDRIMVMYEGRKVAERQSHETNLQEVIELIVQA
jgi:simple sugar transport system ATP-binding protein